MNNFLKNVSLETKIDKNIKVKGASVGLFIFSFLLLVPAISFSSNKENYNKAWTEFSNNNRKEARQYFERAVASEPDSKAEAFLSLALLDWSESKDKDAFVHFQKFYESSSYPYPYLYAVYSLPFMNPRRILTAEQLKFYEKIVNEPEMNGTLKAMIYQKLGEHYMGCNNFKKSNELFSRMGALTKWQVLGSFSNISGSGFDKDWGAVKNAKTDYTFKNSVNADVKWYTPSANKPDNWFYFDYYFDLNSIIAYAQTFVDSPVEQEVYLRTGTSGSLKIWVNDAQIATIPEERNCDLDIYVYKTKLNKGANRILIQIGQSEISAANFLLRLTDANGNPVSGLSHSDVFSAYTTSENQPANNILPFFAEEYLQNKINEDPENLLNYLALGEVYLRNDKAYEGIGVLKKAEQFAPESSFINYRLSEAYLRAQNNTNYSREIESIKLNDPDSYIALRYLFNEAVETEKYPEAEDIKDKIKKLYGESSYTEDMELRLYSEKKEIEKMIQLVKKLYLKYPYDYQYMNLSYLIEENIYKNTKGATAILENYCKQYFNTQALDLLAERYISLGNTEKGLKIYKERINKLPYASGFLYNYASLLQKMQRYNEALSITEDIKKLAPYVSFVYNAEGYIYKELRKTDKSKESFKKAIYYSPTSYDSRNQLRLLDNKKSIFDLFPKVDLTALIAKSPSQKDYPEDNSVILLNDVQLVFYPEGAQENRTEIAVKILNQSGIEEWKQYGVDYNSNNQKLILDKYEVIKANGQRVKAETNNRGLVVFTNLEIGDVLHIDYRLQNYYSGVLSKHFFDYSMMQYYIPSLYNRYSILIPSEKDFKYLTFNADIEAVISEIEDMKLYQWISTDMPAIKDEPYMSPIVDTSPMLIFSSLPDWKFMSDWYKDLTTNKLNAHSDYIFKETFAEILKGNENAGQLEKAKLFYEYVLNNITYSDVSFLQSNYIPQKASRTITSRLGDCKDMSTLFVSLCREAGISANLVLLNPRERGKNSMALPINNFTHCIARLDLDGKTYYLELTDNKLPFGAALESNLQSAILPIQYKDEAFGDKLLSMEMPFRMKNEISRQSKLSIEKNDILVSLNTVRTGQLASFYRHRYANMGAEDRLKDVNQAFASDWSFPVKVSNLTFTDLDNLSGNVTSSLDFEMKGALQDVAGMKIFRLPWSDASNVMSLVALETRKFPLEFWAVLYSDSETEQMKIQLPQGKQLVETPKNVKLECSVAVYELTFDTKKTGEIVAKRTMSKKKDVVTVKDYPAFRDFVNAVTENDNKQYAIK